MKNWLLVLLILGLTGCSYRLFSLGSAPVNNQWKKNGVHIQGKDFRICQNKMENVMTERDKYLENKKYGDLTPEEIKEWDVSIDRLDKIFNECAYELGYRFKPDLGWCWEGSFNMRMCDKYKKYRN
ncbi:hypothetical protein EV697_10825 [Bisgaardia hudsonensis]|uniref:Lipoprotein n=1 Tax=Bisgaardia hudsonensis TaxID=109472 RepID=A0A4R2MWI2_9PAST|nr:hypothetical protein [Bisgaardia hudsonensis]QLB12888.1 hypothetical protein A6A11_04325 [Bisgaardia hudsonensis]TCP11302.1 hypothetical protein EV697_10825 [Bisgaardia hudsonensis]